MTKVVSRGSIAPPTGASKKPSGERNATKPTTVSANSETVQGHLEVRVLYWLFIAGP
jgi:hypothetical protein